MEGSQSTVARITFHLPFEITIEILSRLPVKSLLRFKSLCKNWYDLIETPDFISKQLTHFTHNSSSLLITTYNRKTENHAMSLLFNDGFNNGPINIDFPFLNRRNSHCSWKYSKKKNFSIGGICNGLVCINLSPSGYRVVLCNPSTRQFRKIRNSGLQWLDDPDYNRFANIKRVSFGFGFHPGANDYKLIRIGVFSGSMGKNIIRADLCVMRTDTWREIDVDKASVLFGEMNNLGRLGSCLQIGGSCASAVLNGVFYWPACVIPFNEVIVMSFDMDDELFRRIRTPVCLDETWDETNWQITELKDKLALVIYPDDRYFDVWVLNEDQSSWTNQFKIGSFSTVARNVGCGENGEITILGVAKNGALVVTDHKVSGDLKLFSCDPKTRETKDLYFCRVPYPSDTYMYTGTLLPVMETKEVVLNNKNQKRKHWWNRLRPCWTWRKICDQIAVVH